MRKQGRATEIAPENGKYVPRTILEIVRSVIDSFFVVALCGTITGIGIAVACLIWAIADHFCASDEIATIITVSITLFILSIASCVMFERETEKNIQRTIDSKVSYLVESEKKDLQEATHKAYLAEYDFKFKTNLAEREYKLKTENVEKAAAQGWEKNVRSQMDDLMAEKSQQSPWLAGQYADLLYIWDMRASDALARKKRPARKAAEEVRQIAKEKRELQTQLKMYEYQFDFIKATFPWMEEFIEAPPKDAYASVIGLTDKEGYDKYRNWLSPEEYDQLSTAEKFQLALDRYSKSPKNNWEAGIIYERFIGYEFESQGYRVEYFGACNGYQDLGIDIIAKKDDDTLVIQCKRYSGKPVRENVVFQLFGTTTLYKSSHTNEKVQAAIYTTSVLSDEAKEFSDSLGIQYKESYPLREYPLVKCNISKDGEKIYHLPFDQQYDRVIISGKPGARFVYTVKEAEQLGFRRAHRWVPTDS